MNATKCSGECGGGGRDWSCLPDNVLCDISSRLTFSDYEAFGRVCTCWKSAKGPLSPQMPFLVLLDFEDLESDYKVIQAISDGTNYLIYMPNIRGKYCIGSQEGWLIMIDDQVGAVTLYNPFTQLEIELFSAASLLDRVFLLHSGEKTVVEDVNFYFSPIIKVVLPNVPMPSNDSPQTVVALFDDSFCSLGYKRICENQWYLICDGPKFVDIFSWRGQFLAVGNDGSVYRLDFDEPHLVLVGPSVEYDCGRDCCETIHWKNYLVELDGKLLQVCKSFHPGLNKTTVKVVELDEVQRTWITMDNLHGHSLFLGTSYSVCLFSEQIPGLKADMIYFYCLGLDADAEYRSRSRKQYMGAFNMRNGTFERLPHLRNLCNCSRSDSIWFAPKPIVLQNGTSMLQECAKEII